MKMKNMRSIYIFISALFVSLVFTTVGLAQSNQGNYLLSVKELNEALVTDMDVASGVKVVLMPGFSSNDKNFSANIIPNVYEQGVTETKSSSRNYSRKLTPKVPVQYVADLNWLTTDQVIEEITFFDGLGRMDQKQVMGVSDREEYLVQFYSYDKFGRIDTSFLPFTHKTEGEYLENVRNLQKSFYNNGTADKITDDDSPWGIAGYENSPLNRTLETTAAGKYWHDSAISTNSSYAMNAATDHVKKWSYSSATGNYSGVDYAAGSLFENTLTDENGKTVTTYSDQDGKLILRDQEGLQTYYMYDDFGRMTHILPPEFVDMLATMSYTFGETDPLVSKFCYVYVYGEKSLLIEKHLPGIEKIEYVYDRLNRPVLSRNGNLRSENTWSYIKYDKFGRVAYSGLWTDPTPTRTRSQLQAVLDAETDLYETYDYATNTYSCNVFPAVSGGDIHVVNVYDNYPDVNAKPYDVKTGFDAAYSPATTGLLTVNRVKVLDGSATPTYLESYYYYDQEGQLIQKQSDNVFGKLDISFHAYNFTGQVEQLTVEHEKPDGYLETVHKYYTYDAGGRLQHVEQEIEGDTQNGKVKMAELEYNKLGQLTSKKIHETAGGSFLQNIDYEYNIRGWLTQLNDPDNQGSDNDLFAMRLHYNGKMLATSQNLNNGSISAMEWTVFNDQTSSDTKRAYDYKYDDHYRLTDAGYYSGASLTQDVGRYDVNLTYFKNGKINTLQRKGLVSGFETGTPTYGTLDDLTYYYDGNQLNRVDDAASTSIDHKNHFPDKSTGQTTEYLYDENGNMYFDANKDLEEIAYNHLNLPELVYFDPNNFIEFTYNATGEKLKKRVVQAGIENIYNFVGTLVYKNNLLEQFQTEEGRVILDSLNNTYHYEYFLRDHLGSIRVRFKEGASGTAQIQEENHYYPFGMLISDISWKGEGDNDMLFSGKQLNNELFNGVNLSWYDFHARNYDPQLVMWFNVDPLAENYHNHTPYNYCFSDPVNFIDPTGMGPVTKDANPGEVIRGAGARRDYGGMFEIVSFLDLWWANDGFDNFSTVEGMLNYASKAGDGNTTIFNNGEPVEVVTSEIEYRYTVAINTKTGERIESTKKFSGIIIRNSSNAQATGDEGTGLVNLEPEYIGGITPAVGVGNVQLVRAAQYVVSGAMAAALIKYFQENPVFGDSRTWVPSRGQPWTPSNYTPNNKNYFNTGPGVPNWLQWLMWGTGGAAVGKKLYDIMPQSDIPQPKPQPTTPVIYPTTQPIYNY